MLVQAGSKRTGTAGLRYQVGTWQSPAASQFVYIQEPYQAALSTAIHGIAIRPTLFPLVGANRGQHHGEFFSWADGTNKQISFHLDASGQLLVYNGSNTLLGTTTRQLLLNVWRYLEFKVMFHGTNGTVEVRVDGDVVLSLTGVNTKGSGGNQATAYNIGMFGNNGNNDNTQNLQCDLDDSISIDTFGTLNNNFIGDQAVVTAFPTANSTPLDFSRGGTDSGANFSQVDENPPNGDTDYVFSSTVGNIDHYVFPAITASVIKAMIINIIARKTDGSPRSIRASVKSGATTTPSATDLPLSTTYFNYQGVFETDPNTGLPWTQGGFNAAVKGQKVTV